MHENLFDLLKSGNRLPSAPAAALRVLEISRSEDATVAEITDAIGSDPALSASILRFVNSPMAGVSRQVSSLKQAATLIGLRGVKVIAHALRDAGMEVIYTGLRQSAGQIAAAALQEGVDVIGLSVLSGAYMGIARKLMDRLREEGLEDVLVIFGGNILDRHVEDIKALGVSAVFNHHADLDAIISYIRENAPEPAAG